jgi:ABC-type arginine transport system ATPase subunit
MMDMCLLSARLRPIPVAVRLDLLGGVMAKVVVERALLLHQGDLEWCRRIGAVAPEVLRDVLALSIEAAIAASDDAVVVGRKVNMRRHVASVWADLAGVRSGQIDRLVGVAVVTMEREWRVVIAVVAL